VHDIFISYAREDRASAKKLAEALTATRGWSVWWDLRLRTGERFPREIERVVSEARCVVVLWSVHSINSDWVIAEVAEGWKRGVLVPVLLDASEPPMPFRQTHGADLTGWTGSDRATPFLMLVEDIQRVIDRGAAVDPVELQEREARRRRVHRLRVGRRIGIGTGILAAVVAALLVGRFSLQRVEDRRFGDALVAKAEVIVNGLPLDYNYRSNSEFRSRYWWYVIQQDHDVLALLERSALLSIEGARLGADASRVARTLQRVWSVLPWSDRSKDVDAGNVVRTLEFNRDGRLLAAGGGCGQTLIWNLQSDEITARIDHGSRGGGCRNRVEGAPRSGGLAFSPASDVLATAGPDMTARLWAADGRELKRFEHDSNVTDVHFGPKGDLLVTTDEGGSVRLWEVGTGLELRRVQHDDWAYGAVLSASGKYLASASRDLSTRVWDVATGKELHRTMHQKFFGGTVPGISFCPDDACFVTFGGQEVSFRRIASGELFWNLKIQAAKGVVFDVDRRVIVGAGGDAPISGWDMEQRKPLFDSGATYSDILLHIVGSQNGTLLGTAGGDKTARAWDARTGGELKRLPYTDEVAVAVSPDGRFLASAGTDPLSRKRLLEITEVRPKDLLERTCAHISRNLSPAEWREYFFDAPYRHTCPRINDRPTVK
jgi:WD40 repeat protein